MKKYSLLALLLILFTTLWAQQKGATPAAKTAIPKAWTGHWQKGTFSLTSFEEHNGKYVGPANETSVSYVIDANGHCKEYFISNTNSYNCRMQILGNRQGTLQPTADNGFRFQPTSGYYTVLSCMSKTTTKKPYASKDLYPEYSVMLYLEKDGSGAPVLISKRDSGSSGLQLKKIE